MLSGIAHTTATVVDVLGGVPLSAFERCPIVLMTDMSWTSLLPRPRQDVQVGLGLAITGLDSNR